MTEPCDELQGGKDRVGLERAAEEAELDGVRVGDVDRVVAVALGEAAHPLGLLDPACVLLRRVALGRPPVDVVALAAGEDDDGLEEAVDGLDELELGELLGCLVHPEEVAADVDMEPAGVRVVAPHSLGERRGADTAPHRLARIRHHVLGAHGMGDELAAFIEAAVVLEVEQLLPVFLRNPLRRRLGVAVVHLKLDPEVEPGRLTSLGIVEDGFRLEAVGHDRPTRVVGHARPAEATVGALLQVTV